MGVEAFMVDAGWYGAKFGAWPEHRGDWVEGDWLPGGMAGIREYCHSKGLLFGLWHEAEAYDARRASFARNIRTGCCGPTTAASAARRSTWRIRRPRAFFEEAVLRIIREHKLDFYKLDYNQSVREGGQSLRDGYAENEFWRHHEAIYAPTTGFGASSPTSAWRTAPAAAGATTWACCRASTTAARRTGACSPYSHPRHQRDDACSSRPRPSATTTTNQLGRTLQAHQTADLDTHLRVTLFAVPIFVGFGAQDADRATEYFRKTRRYIELHKGFCRPVLAGHPIVYHHTPDIGAVRPADWCVLEYAPATARAATPACSS